MKRARFPLATLLVLAASALAAQGCASSAAALRSWEGRPSSELIASWGAPLHVLPAERGGWILVYESTRSHTMPGYDETRLIGPGVAIGEDGREPPDTTYGIQPGGFGSGTALTTSHPATTSESIATRTFWVSAEGRITKSAERRDSRVRFAE
jgi:hypothetical protein